MIDKLREPRIFISVAEPSADEHAASLIRAFRHVRPGAVFCGLAGPAMQAEGCACLDDLCSRSAMASAALARIPEALRLLRRLKEHFTEQHYDAAVVVDSPALNLPVAKACRNAGMPVLYYIAPQTWAWGWRWWRNRRLRRRVNRVACIWPFEEAHFQRDGIPAAYVGHPSFDRLLATRVDESRTNALRAGAGPVITLLPGSRQHVIDEVLPGQLEVGRSLAMRHRRARFVAVAASEQARERIKSRVSTHAAGMAIEVVCGAENRAAAICAADLALVASGTITLEVMYRATPMIVMYNTPRWSYQLVGRWVITTPYLSLPNILAGREIVPEFMPYYRSVDPIVARAVEWLASPKTLARVRKDLHDAVAPLAKAGASASAAAQLAAMLEEPR
jgi:lipid-A-disaccharide synthase